MRYLIPVFIIFSLSKVMANPKKSIEKEIEKEIEKSITNPSHGSVPKNLKKTNKDVKFKKNKKGFFEVDWNVLGEYNISKKKAGKNLSKVINKKIVIKGFMIPLDYSAKLIKEFLLVPYIPSCAHVPPPAENMIIKVNVKSKSGVKPSYYPVNVSGKLTYYKSKKKADPYMPNGVFQMDTKSIEVVKGQ